MKQIFTLFALCLFAHASAQPSNEDFESYVDLSQLTAKCWSISGANLHPSIGLNSAKSLQVIPTTSNGGGQDNNAQIITPYINFTANTELTIQYKLSSALSGQATRTIRFSTLNALGAYTLIPSANQYLTKDNSNATTIYTARVTIPNTGTERLVIDFDGNGDGNSYIFMDNLQYASTYNYSGAFSCASLAPMPVKLMSFAGSVVNRKAELRWSVADNETGDRFVMERSTDGKRFTDAATIFTSGKTGGESYTFTETADLASDHYYKLRIVNKDGSVSYSRTVYLKNAESVAGGSAITLLQNPMQSQLAFSYQATQPGLATVNLYNMVGIQLMSFNTHLQPGVNTVMQSLKANVVAGTYILEILHNGERRTTKPTRN